MGISRPQKNPDGCRAGAIVALSLGLAIALVGDVAASQQQGGTGEVSGVVVEFDNTPLPRIVVELRGPFPQNTVRSAVADSNARFAFTGLPAGRYRLSIAFPDSSTASDMDVTVRAAVRVDTTLMLNLQGTNVSVIVQAQAPMRPDIDLSDPESTSGLRIVPGTTIDRLPLPSEQAMQVLPLLPGVIRSEKGDLAIDGSLPTDSVLLFNGIDLMDPYSGAYRVRMPLEAIDRVEVFSGLAPASYGRVAGAIVDISTLPGGESWEWGIASLFPKPRFRDGTIQGIGNASPRLRVSGPIKAGQTYISLAGEYHFDRVTVEDVPGDPSQDHIKTQGWNAFAQVDWRPSERNTFTLSGLVFPQYDEFVGLDGLTPPESTLNVERDAEAILGKHTYRPDANTSFETMLQYNRIGIRSDPRGAEPFVVGTDGFGGNQFHSEDRQTSHFEGSFAYTRIFEEEEGDKSHLVQFGGDLHRLHLSGGFHNDTILVTGADDRLLQRIDFVGSPHLVYNQYEWAGFVLDRWTHSRRFWCDLGLRYSSDSFTDTSRLAPRVGVAWDPVGEGRTLLKASLGIVYRRVFIGEILWDELPVRLETSFEQGGGATLRSYVPTVADDLTTPRTTLFTTDFSHRFDSGWLLRGRYSRREGRDNIIVDRIDPQGVALAAGVDPVARFNASPAQESGALLLSNDGDSTSWSVELTVAKRLPTGGEFLVSYVRSSSFGDLNDFAMLAGELPDAIIRPNVRSKRDLDVPHRLLGWATFEIPYEITVAPVVEWRTGLPYSRFNEDQSYLGAANSERFPSFFSLDLQATRAFVIGGYRLIGGVKITNLTGHDNPRQVISNVASGSFGELRNSAPFRLRAKFAIRF